MSVLNDAAYGAEQDKFETAWFDPAACFTNWAEFADIAIGLASHGVTVRSEAQAVAAIENLPNLGRQVLIDIKSDPTRSEAPLRGSRSTRRAPLRRGLLLSPLATALTGAPPTRERGRGWQPRTASPTIRGAVATETPRRPCTAWVP